MLCSDVVTCFYKPCWAAFPAIQQIALANSSSVQVLAFNIENVFTRLVSSIDSTAVKNFAKYREDMSAYPSCIDVGGVAMDGEHIRING